MNKRILSHFECQHAAHRMVEHMLKLVPGQTIPVYGVPRGGIPVSYLLMSYPAFHMWGTITDDSKKAKFIVDDVIDSGRTRDRYCDALHDNVPFLALTDFLQEPKKKGEWVVFPWEQTDPTVGKDDASATDIVVRLLQYVGEDPEREGLKETPARVLKAWQEWTSGYGRDPREVLKSFEDGREDYDEMIVVQDLPFYSQCEHHLAPFFGTATIAYVPGRRIVGLSKLGRLLEIFSRRLQVQERLTTQIAHALQEHLQPKGVAVHLKARHMCMESRGLKTQGHATATNALLGVFMTDSRTRTEFMSMVSK